MKTCQFQVWDKEYKEKESVYVYIPKTIPMTSLFPGVLVECGKPAKEYNINKGDGKGIQTACLCLEHYELVKDSNDYSEIRAAEIKNREEKKTMYGAKLL